MASTSLHLLQARYADSPNSFATARALIGAKAANCVAVLTRSRQPERNAIFQIRNLISQLQTAKNKRSLFLIEARISKNYWTAFRNLLRAPSAWKRIHPGALDPWNQALNIGYTILLQKVRRLIIEAGLDPEISILHASHANESALAYDLMELFRQPLVDAAIIRLFSRVHEADAIDPREVIKHIAIRGLRICSYRGQRVTREKTMELEIGRFKTAIRRNDNFQPTKIRI